MLAIATNIDDVDVDVDALDHALRHGTHRRDIFDDLETVRSGTVQMSPHLFLPDGTDITNPGLSVHWQGDWAKGFPVIDRDDRNAYDDILTRAAQQPSGARG